MHKRTDVLDLICNDRDVCLEGAGVRMIFIASVVATLTLVVIVPVLWARLDRGATPIGWMSEQWLAEFRASHPSS